MKCKWLVVLAFLLVSLLFLYLVNNEADDGIPTAVINDPTLYTVGGYLEYFDAVVSVGSTRSQINGLTLSWHNHPAYSLQQEDRIKQLVLDADADWHDFEAELRVPFGSNAKYKDLTV